jgi:hypothetical protein
MTSRESERGTTLIEAVVAAGLLATVAAGTASLIALARRLGHDAEQTAVATALASGRLQALRAVPWRYGMDGSAPEVPALAYSPPDALDRNAPGFWDVLGVDGRMLDEHAPGAAFVRRWAIRPVLAGPAQARALEVCVFKPPAALPSVPLSCVASVRTRQP